MPIRSMSSGLPTWCSLTFRFGCVQFDQWRRTMPDWRTTPLPVRSRHPSHSHTQCCRPASGPARLPELFYCAESVLSLVESSRGLQPQDGRAQRFDCCSVHRGRVTRLLLFWVCAFRLLRSGCTLCCRSARACSSTTSACRRSTSLPAAISSVGHLWLSAIGPKISQYCSCCCDVAACCLRACVHRRQPETLRWSCGGSMGPELHLPGAG